MWSLWKLVIVCIGLFTYRTPTCGKISTTVNPVVNKVNGRACRTDEYYNLLRGCQLCSTVENPYQEVVCSCEPFRDAVIGCKDNGTVSSFCTPRGTALEECTKRTYTFNLTTSAIASANGTAVPSHVSISNVSSTQLSAESTQPSFTTVTTERQSTTVPTSSGGSTPSISSNVICIGVACFLVVCAVIGGIFLAYRQQKAFGRRRTTDDYEACELSKLSPSSFLATSHAQQFANAVESADGPNSEENDH